MLTSLSQPAFAQEHDQLYKTQGDCDGFLRIALQTKPGLCIGLVKDHLGFARGVAVIGSDWYVADMGGWVKGKGRLLRLAQNGRAAPEVLLDKLDQPNALVATLRGTLYLGVLGKILEFDPKAAKPAASLREVVTGLPDTGRHPLPALALADDGSLYINVGSASDNCETPDGKPPLPQAACPETQGAKPRGVILHVTPRADGAVDALSGELFAKGLRNSMALALAPSGQLVAASNARDYIDHADSTLSDEDLPHDTLQWARKGADYGWPYCFDGRRASPEYPRYDCTAKTLPTRLLPPHAAPLGMLFYKGRALPGLQGKLVIAYHGFRKQGHRIVRLALDEKGLPQGEPENIVWGWDAASGNHPQGAPVALAQLPDGSLLVSEDLNGTLLRLAREWP